ncbi:MAG: ABC transporter ATP-binding protein, partial [Oscillospiraceae bacterium]|nr:ABC transporter ATP-binding protein [Oscillospiraceae bacterium]
MEKLLNVTDLLTTFKNDKRENTVVDGVSYYLRPGEIIGLVGESGSGKSITMMSSIQLLADNGRVCSGIVELDENGENILDYSPRGKQMQHIRGGRIGMIFQEPMTTLNPVMTVGYQLSETIMIHLKLNKAEAKKRAIEWMKKVNIPDAESRYNYYPQQFSGGMRQRIVMAMVLAAEPSVIIADEATTALDVTTQAQLLEMIRDLAKEKNISVVIVTHNLGVVARYAERIYVMYAGNVVETADAATLFKNPCHPYTRGLLRAIPRLNDPKGRVLYPIYGLPPTPAERPSYCPFYNRCKSCTESCTSKQKPELREIEPGHFIACWYDREEQEKNYASHGGDTSITRAEKTVGEEKCIVVNDLTKSFDVRKGLLQRKVGSFNALEGISFYVRKGETLGIVGESGCGKTTLAKCIMRMIRPSGGTINFLGEDITDKSQKDLRHIRADISMVFQDPFSSLDGRQSAGSIIGEALKLNHLTKTQEEYDRRVEELMTLVGLSPAMKDRMPHEFSGGQRQRISIARALSSNPKVIICDEPISALDVSIQAQIINLLEELQSKLGLTYLFIAHDLAVVKHISDRILVMYLGKVMEIADCNELYDNPLHPYSQALLSAVPVADPEEEKNRPYYAIEGEVPSVMNRPNG